MSTSEPDPRELPCSGNDFVATARNFGASTESAKQIWRRVYCRIRIDGQGNVSSYSVEEAARGSLTCGALYDFFNDPNEAPLFEDMNAQERRFMLNTVQYLTQHVTA